MAIPRPSKEDLLRSRAPATPDAPSGGVRIAAVANLPTRFGSFQVVAFHSFSDGKEHAALVHGDVGGRSRVPVRLHSECLTGDTFGSLRCDCRDQLERALREISSIDCGLILYLRQEGRGIGFENKIKAYQLQEEGMDTVEANQALGFRPDERDYEVAAQMLATLDVRSILLMSNNPAKISDLRAHGVKIEGRIPIEVKPNEFNARYLETKRVRQGHLLTPSTLPPIVHQFDCLTCPPPAEVAAEATDTSARPAAKGKVTKA